MKIRCPNCNLEYEIAPPDDDVKLKCGACNAKFLMSAVSDDDRKTRRMSSVASRPKQAPNESLLKFGGCLVTLLVAGLLVWLYFAWNDTRSTLYRWRMRRLAGVEQNTTEANKKRLLPLRNEADLRTEQMVKQHPRYPREASFSGRRCVIAQYKLEPQVLTVDISGTVIEKNAVGVKSELKYYATWHYDQSRKTWTLKHMTLGDEKIY